MDGNRRWADENHAERYGKESRSAVVTAIETALSEQIRHLSLFVFSIENSIARPRDLQEQLIDELCYFADQQSSFFVSRGVRVRFCGDRSLYSEKLLKMAQRLESETVNGKVLDLSFLCYYGGQQEVLASCREIALKVARGELSPESLTLETLYQYSWTSHAPNPDLIIRTGGAHRLSNFYLLQSAYSELSFLDVYWPAITQEILHKTIAQYRATKRNFGT